MFRNKQWIFNFIALLILLTGMCVDEVRADSVFTCLRRSDILTQTSDGLLVAEKDVMPDTVFLKTATATKSLICTRTEEVGSRITAQIITERKTIRLSVAFLCIAVFSILLSNFYAVEHIAEVSRFGVQTTVLAYIHNTDGKK